MFTFENHRHALVNIYNVIFDQFATEITNIYIYVYKYVQKERVLVHDMEFE